MEKNHACPSFPHFIHGGDYNPEQWIDDKSVWDEDMRLMKLAGCNVTGHVKAVTIQGGIFTVIERSMDTGRNFYSHRRKHGHRAENRSEK